MNDSGPLKSPLAKSPIITERVSSSTPRDSSSTPRDSVPSSRTMDSTPECRRKLEYTHIWEQIDTLCNTSAHIQNSFQLVFGEVKDTSYGTKAKADFDTDMELLITQLERVCRLLKEDETAQRSLALVLYESSVAAYNETDTSKLSDASFSDSFDNINTSRTDIEVSLNDSMLLEQRLNPAKRRRISFNTEYAVPPSATPQEQPMKPAAAVRFTTPQPTARCSTDRHMSIAKMALSEARKNGHHVTSLSDFIMIKPISKGAYGKVYLARRRNTSEHYAIKIMKKEDLIRKNMVDQVVTERDALALAKSPFIVKLFYSFQSKYEVYFVMEYLIGGDLCSFLSYVGCLEEEHAVLYVVEVALALGYLHKHNIIHKDIKPENMLLDRAGHVKLTDFGLSSIRLQRKLTISDLVYSPYTGYSPSHHWRTPGQLVSLTTNLAFRSSPRTPPQGTVSAPTVSTRVSTSASVSTPITRRKRFLPKRCSFGNTSLNVSKSPATSSLTVPRSPEDCNQGSTPGNHGNQESGNHGNTDCADSSIVSHYRDEDISFGESRSGEYSTAHKLDSGCSDITQGVSRVIGTPDYVAPELLLHRPHTTAADWWSLGVCFYEMLAGIPPFHDSNIPDIFRNILNLSIEWPDDITGEAKDAIEGLLQFEASERSALHHLKQHAFFEKVDWENMLGMEMPFIPQPENDTDTGYFEGHNSAFNIRLSDFDGCSLMQD